MTIISVGLAASLIDMGSPLAYTRSIAAIPHPAAALLVLLGCAARPAPAPAPPAPAPAPAPAPSPAPPASTPAPHEPLDALAWLAGTWESDDPAGPRTIEHWLAPAGGTMLGVNRTTHAGQTVFFEYLRLESRTEGLALLASPLGRDPPTRFLAAESGPTWVAFENPEHDFPQRIEYRREGDRLLMRISGHEGGAPKASAWSMHRVSD
jgi:Domain of unknown function (DUF6265)